jgi:mannose/fructose-specific phosphotransferase system component IIA
MIGLVLVTHGRLAAEFITAMEHVVGPQEAIEGICIGPDDDMEARRRTSPTRSAASTGQGRDHPHRPVRRHARPTSPSA